MGLVGGLEGDVAGHLLLARLDQVHRADVAAGLADGRGHLAEHAGLVGDTEADGEAIAGDRGVLAHGVAGLLADVVRTLKHGERPRSASRPAGLTGCQE